MGKQYRVTAEYVTVVTAALPGGRAMLLGFYRDAILPPDVSDEAIEHHLSTNQIEEVEEAEVPPAEVPPEVVAGDQVDEPKKSDDRPAWVDYAVSKGADRADIEEKKTTKADLIAAWGTPK